MHSRITVIEKTTEHDLNKELVDFAQTHTVIDTYSYKFDETRFFVATLASKQMYPSTVDLLVN
jgi:hypothetical protein